MLQIISGKFFSGGKVNERESDAILYSNYSWLAPINTCIAELRPVDTHTSIASYALRYTNRYEPAPGRDPMVFAASEEAVEQFRLLCSFYFRSFFHVDRAYVQNLCRTQATHSFDTTLPSTFVPKFFDLPRPGTQPETVGFVEFVAKTVGMPRKQYVLLMSCLGGFFEAQETIGKNFDLAYSMMVYMLEALSKSLEQPQPVWEDYDQNLRVRLDKELASASTEVATGVRGVLLDNPHLKLKKRFISFISDHVKDSYFTSEADGLQEALVKSELARALGNLYDARSGYVHELRQVQEHLRLKWIGPENDVFHWGNEPHITFAGLVRLGWHVLNCFIERQPVIEHEDYPWRNEIPGMFRFPLAPEYWAGRPDTFRPDQARQRLCAFIGHCIAGFGQPKSSRLDLRPLMEPIERYVPPAKPTDRLPMLALYWMFNGMIPTEGRRPDWERFLEKWKSDLDQCSIELIAMFVVWGENLPWPAEECASAFARYQRSRYSALAMNLPRLVEIAIVAEVANGYMAASQIEQYKAWIDTAMLDAAGRKPIQDYLRACRERQQRVDSGHILGRPQRPSTATVNEQK